MILGAGVTFHHQSHIPVLHRPRASSKQPGPGAGEGKRPPSHIPRHARLPLQALHHVG